MNEIPIQPSSTRSTPTGALTPGTQYGGTLTPGIPGLIPAVVGIAGCDNLVADSPPTLFEEFAIYSFSIPVGLACSTGETGDSATFAFLLQLMLNDRVAASYSSGPVTTPINPQGVGLAAGYAFVSDLTNPLKVGGRDRLGLKLFATLLQTTGTPQNLVIAAGVKVNPNPAPPNPVFYGGEAKLFYETASLPGRRRL